MKKFKSIVSLLLVCSMLMGLAACSSSGSSKKKSKKSSRKDRYDDDDDDRSDKKDKKKKKKKDKKSEDTQSDSQKKDSGKLYDYKMIAIEELDVREDKISYLEYEDGEGYLAFTYGHASVSVSFERYSEDDFEDCYDDILDDYDDDVFDGDIDDYYKNHNGYVVFEGYGEDDGVVFQEDMYYYGGVYLKDGCYIVVITNIDSRDARNDVDDVLDEFDLEMP